jgi:ligand-binding sensor domain-containing protein/two-component sensor histidine kinase
MFNLLQKELSKFCRKIFSALTVFAVCAFFVSSIPAESLSLKNYTVSDGLPDNSVYKILQDSRGFFWIATFDGVSRFDGADFTNFSLPQGLPSRRINDIIQSSDGSFWLATQSGLVHFNPEGQPHDKPITAAEAAGLPERPMFVVYVPEGDERVKSIAKVFQDSSGTIWAGSLRGLFRMTTAPAPGALENVEIGLPKEMDDRRNVNVIFEDSFQTLWIGTPSGLFRRPANGEVARFDDTNLSKQNSYRAIYQTEKNRLWVGTTFEGLLELEIGQPPEPPKLVGQFKEKDGLISNWINDILKVSEQEIWLATDTGLVSFKPRESFENRFRVFTRTSEIGFRLINCLYRDSYGNLWFGTKTNGFGKISPGVWTVFGEKDGIEAIRSVFTQKNGALGIIGFVTNTELDSQGIQARAVGNFAPFHWRLGSYDNEKFSWVKPNFPTAITDYGWGDKQISFQASDGEWWIATGQGLFRFPAADNITDLATLQPKAIYNSENGLVPEGIFRLFEDSRGDIWISTDAKALHHLYRWQRSSETLQNFSKTEGFPLKEDRTFTCFREDFSGNIWIGLNQSGVLRFQDGRFQLLTEADGIPKGWIKDLLIDQKGRLWIASTLSGVVRIDEPNNERLQVASYNKTNGLTSDNVSCLLEDRAGFMYLATDKGIDRLDADTGKVRHFTAAQGVPRDEFRTAHLDKNGVLWFGMAHGLLKYRPQEDPPVEPPNIWITALDVEGKPQRISAIGTDRLHLPELSAGQNQVRINFTGISSATDETLRYQYKFAVDADWSAPNKERFVNFANLSPGSYQILIRAVTSDGTVSPVPAVVSFTILTPIYLRWWFLLGLGLLIGGLIYLFYHWRFLRLLEMERMRTRIATDLHDDIGANLTRISLLSEVARQKSENGNGQLLSSIADIARESVSSMNDIVWAISPEHDRLLDLTRRMRQHAAEVFALRDIDLTFNAPSASDLDLPLSVGVRRDVLLIFKEAVNNAARHSDCTKVEIDFNCEKSLLTLQIKDNGQGFTRDPENEGEGLRSMTRRAKTLNGSLKIESEADRGTIVKFEMSLPKAAYSQM